MSVITPKHHHLEQPAETTGVDCSTTSKVEEGNDSLAHWYSGITQGDTLPSTDFNIKVVDKGTSVEFVLPRKTAQFAEISVLDTKGKLVWKTQSFNKNTIIWPKQTTLGGKVPKARYTFRMKQGNHQVDFPLVA